MQGFSYNQIDAEQVADYAIASEHHDHADSSAQHQTLNKVRVFRCVGLRHLQSQSCSRHHSYAQKLKVQRLLTVQ